MPANKKRTKAREIAIQGLYQFDLQANDSATTRGVDALRSFLQDATTDGSIRRDAISMIDGVLDCIDDIDDAIRAAAANWSLERIAAIDRAILRLGTFELLEAPDVPPRVAINEAIELAKRFSTAESGGFVNGILDRIHRNEESESSSKEAASSKAETSAPGRQSDTGDQNSSAASESEAAKEPTTGPGHAPSATKPSESVD